MADSPDYMNIFHMYSMQASTTPSKYMYCMTTTKKQAQKNYM